MSYLGLFALVSALPCWCTYAFLTTVLSKASILVNISSVTLRELSFPLDMLTKLIVYCSQHVRTAGFALDCKMFGKPHAFSEAGSVPCVPASAAAFAFTQNVGSCPDEPGQRRASASDWPNSTGVHVTMAKIFLAATGTDFPAERAGALLRCSPLDPQINLLDEWASECDLDTCLLCHFPTQGRLQLFLAAELPMERL